MNEGDVRFLASVNSLVAEMNSIIVSVEAMKIANKERESQGYSYAYDEDAFNEASSDLMGLSIAMRNL